MKLREHFFTRGHATALAALAALTVPQAAFADFVFYATADSRSADVGALWIYDTATDQHTFLADLDIPVHALDFGADGVLYSLSGPRGSALENRFFSINLSTGEAAGISGTSGNLTEMSFDEAGVLYVTNNSGFLYTIDTPTGTPTNVGDGDGRRSLAIDSAGNAFEANGSSFYSVDLATGATTPLGTLTGLMSRTMGMDFAADDTLYAVDYTGCCSFSSRLVTIDTATLATTAVTDLPPNTIALAITDAADSDSDGIPDVFEIAAGRDPNDAADAAVDADGDGLTFLEEYELGISDDEPDFDGDGLEDGEEVELGTEPKESDSDRDGIKDGAEVVIEMDPTLANNGRVELTGGTGPRHVNIAQDADGRYHLVWDADDGTGEWRVHYGLIDADGTILIDGTVIADANGNDDAQPQIAVDAAGKAYVAWQDNSSDTYFALVDPSADSQDGDAADPAVIVTVPETTVAPGYRHGQIAVDANGNSFIVMEDGDSDIAFIKVDNTGTVTVPATSVIHGTEAYHTTPGIAIDADGNIHMAWGEGGTLYYAMAQGSDGAILIAPTAVASATVGPNGSDNAGAKFANPVFNADGILYVVFADKEGLSDGSGGGIHYLAIDPSLDDQSGDAGDADELVVKGKTGVTDGMQGAGNPWYPDGTFDAAGNLTVVWNGGGGGDENPETVVATSVDDTGAANGALTLTSEFTHSQNGNESRISPPHAAGNRIAYSDDNVVTTVFFGTPADAATAGGAKTSRGGLSFFERIAATALPTAAQALPEDIEFPFDFFRLAISGLSNGQTTTLTLTLPTDVPENAVVYKYTPAGGWFVVPHVLGFNSNEILVQLTDGGQTDADGIADGAIVDPIAVGVGPGTPPVTPVNVSGSGGGCVIGDGERPFDPLFPALFALAAAYVIRRRVAN